MKTMMAVAALALATGNVRADDWPLDHMKTPSPADAKAFKAIVAQGGPSCEQSVAAIELWIQRTFYDPYSVRDLTFALPYWNTRATVHKDWVIVFECNAKNRMGGYVGLQRMAVMWKNGALDVEATQNCAAWQEFAREVNE